MNDEKDSGFEVSRDSDSPIIQWSFTPEAKAAFWKSFIRAVEAEPRDLMQIRGASGLVHPIITAGVDDKRKRIIIISADPDGRSAALTQSDIQAAIPSAKVILARPIHVNLSKVAEAARALLGKSYLSMADLDKLPKTSSRVSKKKANQKVEATVKHLFDAGVAPAFRAFSYASTNLVATWQDVVMQLSHLQLENTSASSSQSKKSNSENQIPMIRFGNLAALDPAEVDRKMGICSVPLYEFAPDEAEVFHAGNDVEHIRYILKRRNIFQYYFPPADQLALAVLEHEQKSTSELLETLEQPPKIGHPLGALEIVSPETKFNQMIEALLEKKLCVEGEIGIELTDQGKLTRGTIRFKPREGFFHKLSQFISLKVDISLKDILKLSTGDGKE